VIVTIFHKILKGGKVMKIRSINNRKAIVLIEITSGAYLA
jgi:hypothetical protein